MNKIYLTLLALFATLGANAAGSPAQLYIYGNPINGVNSWSVPNGTWQNNNMVSMGSKTNNQFSQEITFGDSGDGYAYFRFTHCTNAHYDNGDNFDAQSNNYSATTSDQEITVNAANETVGTYGQSLNAWKVKAGTYVVTVRWNNNSDIPYIKITKEVATVPTSFYLVGTGGFGYDNNGNPKQLDKDGTSFSTRVTFSGETYFRFATSSSTATNYAYGSGSENAVPSKTGHNSLTKGDTNNYKIAKGTYDITVDFSDAANPYFTISEYTAPVSTTWKYSTSSNGSKTTIVETDGTYSFTQTLSDGNSIYLWLNDKGYMYDESGYSSGGAYWITDSKTSTKLKEISGYLYFHNDKSEGAGTYTFEISKSGSDWYLAVTKKEEGGGNNENPEGYGETVLGFTIETPDPKLILTSYYIPTPEFGPNSKGVNKQLEVKHSHAGQKELEYTWVKYHDRDAGYSQAWMYYEADDNIPAVDESRIAIIKSHSWYQNSKYNAESIAGRAHAVNNNTGASHDCRNFDDAYYRVYGEMPEHPGRAKAVAKARLRGHVVPANLDKKARVAYTLAVSDNTSGIDEVVTDAAATDAAPVYYNLQGVVVANPQAGQVYIVRRGETVTKELYR